MLADMMKYVNMPVMNIRKYTLRDMLMPFVWGKVLDVGCWEGEVANELRIHPDTRITSIIGIDPFLPPNPKIPVANFDGLHIPFGDKEFDTALCTAVLHHSTDPGFLLDEMKRVAKEIIVLEDSFDSPLNKATVIFGHESFNFTYNMDYDPAGFHSSPEWKQIFSEHGLQVVHEERVPSCGFLVPMMNHYIYILRDENDNTPTSSVYPPHHPPFYWITANYRVRVVDLSLLSLIVALAMNFFRRRNRATVARGKKVV